MTSGLPCDLIPALIDGWMESMAASCIVIGIAGASGSGKSTLAAGLQTRLEEHLSAPVLLLGEDAYYRDQSALSLAERATQNYDDPAALDHDLLLQHLQQLRSGRSVQQPDYDYTRHTRSDETVLLEPAPCLLVEGLFLLARPALRHELTVSLFVDTAPDLCLLRRLRRDMASRGRTAESVLQQYEQTVRPGYIRHVAPSRAQADTVVDGSRETTAMIDQGWRALCAALPRLRTGD
ncbi:MAG: uridine kinase [Natronospirillum sp.]|uniref:uridine kinase n=1 Tax=Natronospirillum sp. TaxID=2812955 RepID=UPI0025D34C7C|nr:uridine kinase [Natronospirillum sp.]MCH8550452.1 uridine kinase [Natronospirillum sp.]